jgi:hypothetical protein
LLPAGRVIRYRDGATLLPTRAGLVPPEYRLSPADVHERRAAALLCIKRAAPRQYHQLLGQNDVLRLIIQTLAHVVGRCRLTLLDPR